MELPSFSFPPILDIKLSLILNTTVLSALLIIFSVFYVVVTSILLYHWSAYGMKTRGIVLAESVFLSVTLVLFCTSIVSLFYI